MGTMLICLMIWPSMTEPKWVNFQCSHDQLSAFYHLSTLDVMHVRKDTRPSVFFVHQKMTQAWERG